MAVGTLACNSHTAKSSLAPSWQDRDSKRCWSTACSLTYGGTDLSTRICRHTLTSGQKAVLLPFDRRLFPHCVLHGWITASVAALAKFGISSSKEWQTLLETSPLNPWTLQTPSIYPYHHSDMAFLDVFEIHMQILWLELILSYNV